MVEEVDDEVLWCCRLCSDELEVLRCKGKGYVIFIEGDSICLYFDDELNYYWELVVRDDSLFSQYFDYDFE